MSDKIKENLIGLSEETLEKCQEFYDEHSKEYGKRGFVWLKNDETGQLMVYTRGEYTEKILRLLESIKDEW